MPRLPALSEHSVAFGVAAAEEQAQDRDASVVLPDPGLDDELAAADSQRVARGRCHAVSRPILGNQNRGTPQPSLVFEREGKNDSEILLVHELRWW